MRTLVVIPAYNEATQISAVIQGVRTAGYEVLVVDDCSQDATARIAHAAGAAVVRHPLNRGYGAALTTGNAWAVARGYDMIVHCDADGQHDPAEIAALLEPIVAGHADVVLGSRFLKRTNTIPPIRRCLIQLAVVFTRIVSGVRLSDTHNGFRAFSGRACAVIRCHEDGMAYASEVIDQLGEHRLQYAEVPVTIRYTEYSKAKGESNMKKILLGFKFLWGKFIK